MLKLVRPQHFLPVHGEYSFLCAHAELARNLGIRNTNVIRNGEMLGCAPLRNNNALSGLQLLGHTGLQLLYNDGNNVSPQHLQLPSAVSGILGSSRSLCDCCQLSVSRRMHGSLSSGQLVPNLTHAPACGQPI